MVEITDYDSANAWLETQAHQTQVWFAARCALRALPACGILGDATKNGLAFAILRAQLISAAAATCPAADMKRFADAAFSAAFSAADAAHSADAAYAAHSAAHSADAAFSAAHSDAAAAHSAALSVARSARSADAARTAAFSAAHSAASLDTEHVMRWNALWAPSSQPKAAQEGWVALKQQWQDDENDWSFWVEWYEAILNGTPLPWELTQRIALEVTEEEWNAGPGVVSKRIKDIETQFLSDRTPLAETLTLDPATGLFQAEAIEIQNPPLMAALLSRVMDGLEDAVQGNNGLNPASREVRVLNRTLSRYANDPQRIEMDLTSIAIGLRRQLHETRELPQSEDNHALLEAVEEGVRGIRANYPDVASNRTQLAQQEMRQMPDEDRELMEEAQPVLMAISQDRLREDFATDIPQLINDALTPLPSGAPPLPGADETTRVFGRVSRMALLYKEVPAQAAKVFDSDAVKSIRLVGVLGGVGGVLYALVQMGLRILGVL